MRLHVYRDRECARDLVGTIDFEPGGSASFTYGHSYLENAQSNGEHRELSEIDERDLLAAALDLGVSLDDWDAAIRQIVDGISPPDAVGAGEALQAAMTRILETAAPRVAVLERFIGVR